MTRAPLVPPEQRSPAGAGSTPEGAPDDEMARDPGGFDTNIDQQGRQGGIRQNTTHQGLPRGRGFKA